MSLRAKLFLLFAVLVVAPLVAIGVFDYLRTMRALEALIGVEVDAIARRAAQALADRHAVLQSDLLLLAENAETQRLVQAHAGGDSTQRLSAYAAADRYLRQAWATFAGAYQRIAIKDAAGELLYELGEATTGGGDPAAPYPLPTEIVTVVQPVSLTDGQAVGEVVATARLSALLPLSMLETRFGATGYSIVVDRADGRVLYHPRHSALRQPAAAIFGPEGWNVNVAALDRDAGTLRYREGDTTRVAAFVRLTEPAWMVLASGSVTEFAGPFGQVRTVNLVLVLLLAAVVTVVALLLVRGATRSLDQLTVAADAVGRGNLDPPLPPTGSDEAGRLSAAFGIMLRRVRTMMAEIEASRQMAAVGEFASRLAHEIRNPLTSLKLNLQGLERDLEAGRVPASSARPVEISLREVQRLDRVVAGALALGRARRGAAQRVGLHALLREKVELLRPQIEPSVKIVLAFEAAEDAISGDAERLAGAFLNLLLNAAEAMPEGGTLHVSTELAQGERPQVRVRIADTGPGIPAAARAEIFRPFYTTKAAGTGFGLPIATRVVEEHDGRLVLVDPPALGCGAEFLVELPLGRRGGV